MLDTDERAQKVIGGNVVLPPAPPPRTEQRIAAPSAPARTSVMDMLFAGLVVAAVAAGLMWVSATLLP